MKLFCTNSPEHEVFISKDYKRAPVVQITEKKKNVSGRFFITWYTCKECKNQYTRIENNGFARYFKGLVHEDAFFNVTPFREMFIKNEALRKI